MDNVRKCVPVRYVLRVAYGCHHPFPHFYVPTRAYGRLPKQVQHAYLRRNKCAHPKQPYAPGHIHIVPYFLLYFLSNSLTIRSGTYHQECRGVKGPSRNSAHNLPLSWARCARPARERCLHVEQRPLFPSGLCSFSHKERVMTAKIGDLDAYDRATMSVADGLLWRWLPITIVSLTGALHTWAQAETWATIGGIVFCIGAVRSLYLAAWATCAILALLFLTVSDLYTANTEYWGLLSGLCLVGIVAAQYLRPPEYRLLELEILRNKLPYPRLMVHSVITPVLLSNILWVANGADVNAWLAVHITIVAITLLLGIYYAWVYSE